MAKKQFQSTQPKRAATGRQIKVVQVIKISIHAAQEGCDAGALICKQWIVNFNPRSPRGLRQQVPADADFDMAISIHAAQEGCDIKAAKKETIEDISIHAAQEGCDCEYGFSYPDKIISIHAAQEGCDSSAFMALQQRVISIHAAQEGCDLQ